MVPLLRRLCAFETCAPCVFGVWPFSTLLRQLCALGILWSWLCVGFLPQCYKLKPCVRVTFLAVLAASLVLVPGDHFPSEQACLGVSSRADVVDFVLTPGDFYPAGLGVLLSFVLRSSRKWLLYLWVFFWPTHPTLLPHTSILKPHCNSYLLLQTSWHDSFSDYRLLCRSFLNSLMHALCAAIAVEPAHAVMGYTSISTRILIICLSLEASGSFVSAMGPTHLNDSCIHMLAAAHLAWFAFWLVSFAHNVCELLDRLIGTVIIWTIFLLGLSWTSELSCSSLHTATFCGPASIGVPCSRDFPMSPVCSLWRLFENARSLFQWRRNETFLFLCRGSVVELFVSLQRKRSGPSVVSLHRKRSGYLFRNVFCFFFG